MYWPCPADAVGSRIALFSYAVYIAAKEGHRFTRVTALQTAICGYLCASSDPCALLQVLALIPYCHTISHLRPTSYRRAMIGGTPCGIVFPGLDNSVVRPQCVIPPRSDLPVSLQSVRRYSCRHVQCSQKTVSIVLREAGRCVYEYVCEPYPTLICRLAIFAGDGVSIYHEVPD